MDEHLAFIKYLHDEYLKERKQPVESQYGNKVNIAYTMNRMDKIIFTRFNDYVDYAYNYYRNILELCKNTKSISKLSSLRGTAHLWGHQNNQPLESNMSGVVQDAVYYYLSRLNPQMHKINLMFIDFFAKKEKVKAFIQPHHKIYNFRYTPAYIYFKDNLICYIEKYLDEIEYSPIFTVFLYPLSFTEFGKNNILEVLNIFGVKLEEYSEKNGKSLLRYHFERYKIRNLNRMIYLKRDIILLSKEAENEYRQNKNLPKIGEYWIEETRLYYLIKEDFPSLIVIQHGKPKFLGKQHYNIWIPKIMTAVEYQGEQHHEPIEFFGGEIAYKTQTERDLRKQNLSKENGVFLVNVSKGYNYEDLKRMIDGKFRKL